MTVPHSRRRLVLQLLSAGLLGAAGLGSAGGADPLAPLDPRIAPRFLHGVASGDPLAERVLLWTRVTPAAGWRGEVPVTWIVTADPGLRQVVATGTVVTSAARDFTVKADATGLEPGRTYFYQFQAGRALSPVGRTRTLPAHGARTVRLAAFCCSNYPAGYFHAYADAARRDDLDAVLHLGDYIYEYGPGGYATGESVRLGRVPQPAGVLMTLADYRARYAQYRTDPDLQALHAAAPWITVWDDHEFADDTWRAGAADHDEARSPFAARRAAAVQAYHEWLPLRAPDPARPERIYRSFDFGGLLALHMLDTRLIGRDRQLDLDRFRDRAGRIDVAALDAAVNDPGRSMLGPEQLAWLDQAIGASRAPWQVLGQQVLMGNMAHPLPVAQGDASLSDLQTLRELARALPERLSDADRATLAAPRVPYFLDSWDGYAAERERVFALLRRHGRQAVVLSGDSHNAWANDLSDADGRSAGVEFGVPSVSSPGLEAVYTDMQPVDVAAMYQAALPAVRYAQTSQRGYLVLTATAAEVRGDWHLVDQVGARHYTAAPGHALRTVPGQPGLHPV